MKCTLDKHQTSPGANHVVACVASVFFRFRCKELGTRVKDRAKNGASKRAGRGCEKRKESSRSIFCAAKTENSVSRLSSIFLCSETVRKRLLRKVIILLSSQKISTFPVVNTSYSCHYSRLIFGDSRPPPMSYKYQLASPLPTQSGLRAPRRSNENVI